MWQKFKGINSLIYCLILVRSRLVIQPCKVEEFQDMIDAIGAYGLNLPAPTYHEIRVPLLNKEVD